jgi:hypothetical protein
MAAGALCISAVATSSFLFLRRLHAVYADRKKIRIFFWALWAIASASTITVPLGVQPRFVPGTHYYQDDGIKIYSGISAFLILLYDTLVFFCDHV